MNTTAGTESYHIQKISLKGSFWFSQAKHFRTSETQ